MSTDFRTYREEYRFRLDRRPGRSRLKLDCPQCGRKRCFSPYVDVTTGEIVGAEFGRCDHERTCGYHNPPKGKDLKDKSLWVDSKEVKMAFLKPRYGDIANYIEHEERMSCDIGLGENVLYRFLASLYDPFLVEAVFRRYMVGTMDLWSWKGCPVFWQIDKDYVCRTGKIMHYAIKKEKEEWVDVKRVKENDSAHVMYYHALKGQDYVLRQCLFGEHLLNYFPKDQTVNIVEAEKTAIICTINKPTELFLATGGLNNFRPEVMGALKNRKIKAFPDKGSAYDVWKKKIEERLPYYGIEISDYLNHVDSVGDGGDIADMIINNKVKEVYGYNNQD